MYPIPVRVFLLPLFFSSLVAATNFTQCLEDFRSDPNAVGGVDSRGHPTSPAEAVGLTYTTCTALCGSGNAGFRWKEFAQLFSSWFLPWLALISQLPFGSENYIDDFLSVVMSLGSPSLAAYSLVLTSLNARSVYRRAQSIRHESKTTVARALVSLQQIPLELTKDERLLAFIPINDQWRREIVDRLNRRNAWSIATGSSVAWVVVAFTFTLVDSFVSLDNSVNSTSEGHTVGTLWLWLLCLVIGWLWVPTFTYCELKSAIGHANQKAAKKAARGVRQKAAEAYDSTKAKVANRLPKRMSILKRPGESVGGFPEAPEENENERMKEGSIREDIGPVGQETESVANPLPNLTHHQSTVSFQLPTESQQGHGHLAVSANPTANQSVVSLSRSDATHSIAIQSSIHPETDRLLIPRNDLSSLNRDELRFAATFNYSRVMRYLSLVDDVLRTLDKLTREKDELPISTVTATQPTRNVVFPPGVLISMFNASILALVLQCGTTAAAAIIIVFTPTVGFGCRSLGYTIYAGISIVILLLTIISTISARISETRSEHSTVVKSFTASIAIALRRTCLLLACINAVGLIVLSCFQFTHFLDNCYCNASVIGRGTDSHLIIIYEGWTSTMRTAWISATTLAAASMAIYMIYLWLISALPTEIDRL